MSLTLAKDLASIFQSVATPLALIIGGAWAYRRYFSEEGNYPHIETAADVVFVGQQGGFWIVELVGILENKGKVRHKIERWSRLSKRIFRVDKWSLCQG